jgi:hypothetical protein
MSSYAVPVFPGNAVIKRSIPYRFMPCPTYFLTSPQTTEQPLENEGYEGDSIEKNDSI